MIILLKKMFSLNLKSSNSNTEKLCKIVVCFFPVFFIIFLVIHKFLFGPFNEDYFNFATEDGLVEYSTAMFYFVSFGLSLIISRNFIKNKKILLGTLYFLFAGIFLFAGLEEISWGQRILNLETTEFFSENQQNETNFHNLPLMSKIIDRFYFIIGFVGSFLWMIIANLKTKKYSSFKKFFVPPRFLMLYFLPIFLLYGLIGLRRYLLISPEVELFNFFGGPDHEIVELLLSIGIFLFLLSIVQRTNTIPKLHLQD